MSSCSQNIVIALYVVFKILSISDHNNDRWQECVGLLCEALVQIIQYVTENVEKCTISRTTMFENGWITLTFVVGRIPLKSEYVLTTETWILLSYAGGFKKFLWILVMMGMASALLYNVIELTKKYLSHPINVKLTVAHQQELTFPSVTVCNMSPIKKSAWQTVQNSEVKSRKKRAITGYSCSCTHILHILFLCRFSHLYLFSLVEELFIIIRSLFYTDIYFVSPLLICIVTFIDIYFPAVREQSYKIGIWLWYVNISNHASVHTGLFQEAHVMTVGITTTETASWYRRLRPF